MIASARSFVSTYEGSLSASGHTEVVDIETNAESIKLQML